MTASSIQRRSLLRSCQTFNHKVNMQPKELTRACTTFKGLLNINKFPNIFLYGLSFEHFKNTISTSYNLGLPLQYHNIIFSLFPRCNPQSSDSGFYSGSGQWEWGIIKNEHFNSTTKLSLRPICFILLIYFIL